MLVSILYALSAIAFFTVFLMVKKDDSTNHSVCAWITIHAAIMMWVNNAIAGVYALVNIPVTLASVSVAYIVMAAAGVWTIRKNGVQQLKWNYLDIASLVLIVFVAVRAGFRLHSTRLFIADVTGDSCMHYRYAKQISDTGIVKGEMFYAPLNIGLFISFMKPFLMPHQYYKAFVAMGIMMLALSGAAFYATISDTFSGIWTRILGLVISMLYMLGYPLHNELMGFNHLGVSITIVVVMVYFLKLYTDGVMQNNWALYILMLGCFSLVMCYMLFAPIIYIVVFIALGINIIKRKDIKEFIKAALKVFLLPCALGLFYCYFSFFGGRGLSIQDAISINGGTRGRFYSYFLILLPTSVYFIAIALRKKQHTELLVLLGMVWLSQAVMLVLALNGRISVYYYTKLPYLVWFVMSIVTWYALKDMLDNDRPALISFVSVFICLFVIWYFDVNHKLSDKATERGYAHIAENYRTVSFGILDENKTLLDVVLTYDPNKIDLYRYMAENLEDETIPLLGDMVNYVDVFWCENFTGHDLSEYYYWSDKETDYLDKVLTDKDMHYFSVLYNTGMYNDHADVLEQFEKVFETSAGCIYRIAGA